MSKISITGLASNLKDEDRALVYLEVHYNDNVYEWSIYVPHNVNLNEFIDNSKQLILSDIDEKEAKWSSLNPKTRLIEDDTGEQIEIEISKNEIVKPDLIDYYALRRKNYPPLEEQLGAIWKGLDSEDFINMKNKIISVKEKYPKK